MKIGFDLDGVLVDGPPLAPSLLLEYLYKGIRQKKLHYRIPKTRIEILIRYISHYPIFRPPISANITKLVEMTNSGEHELYLVTSRYSFLKDQTTRLLKLYGLDHLFKQIYLNLENEQPHLFKLKTLERLKLDIFYDDDERLLHFLREKLPSVKFVTTLLK